MVLRYLCSVLHELYIECSLYPCHNIFICIDFRLSSFCFFFLPLQCRLDVGRMIYIRSCIYSVDRHMILGRCLRCLVSSEYTVTVSSARSPYSCSFDISISTSPAVSSYYQVQSQLVHAPRTNLKSFAAGGATKDWHITSAFCVQSLTLKKMHRR